MREADSSLLLWVNSQLLWCCSLPSDPSHIQETLPRAEQPGHGLSLYHWAMTVRGEGELCIKLKLQAEVTKKRGNSNCYPIGMKIEQSRSLTQGWFKLFRKVVQLLTECLASHPHSPTPRCRVYPQFHPLLRTLFSQGLAWVTFPLEIHGVRLHH